MLSRNTSGELTTLDKLIDYIAAKEAGSAEASDLVADPNLVGVIRKRYTYIQQKQGRNKCQHYGEPQHGSSSQEDRKKYCKAWGKTCKNCKNFNHIAKTCKSAIEAEVNTAAAVVGWGGGWFP